MTETRDVWLPPTGWASGPTPAAGPHDPSPVRTARGSRGRAWLLLAGVAALLAIYLTVITYWLTIHTVDRYEQTEPGAAVSTEAADYTLISLRQVTALPGLGGKPADTQPGEGYVLAQVRMVIHDPDLIASSCALDLLGLDGSTWDYEYLSAVDPQTENADYCDAVVVDQPATVTIGYAVPAVAVDRIAGVVVSPGNGQRKPVLVPPR